MEERELLVSRFEAEMGKVQRPGSDKLMAYIRKSDFYTAPASTRYHLHTKGGLLQHSLNVLDALRGLLEPFRNEDGTTIWQYSAAGKVLATVPDESVIIMALLHDICKTYFYTEGFRWYKDDNNKWQKAPAFNVEDRMPLGHGDKSAFIIMKYMELTNPELYAIWWHMGIPNGADSRQFAQAIEKFPVVYALHTADMLASHFMEAGEGNKEAFAPVEQAEKPTEAAGGKQEAQRGKEAQEQQAAPQEAQQDVEAAQDPEPDFQEAQPVDACAEPDESF